MSAIEQAKQGENAVYWDGTFSPLTPSEERIEEGQHARLTIEDAEDTPLSTLHLLTHIYDGLPEEQIREIEEIILDRRSFFGDRELQW
ncbi:MAG TPA: hypothetical protein VJ183_18585 [Chloroflexia bacterium]|nr:hypothetical protein [Chloroflexia bacterium]